MSYPHQTLGPPIHLLRPLPLSEATEAPEADADRSVPASELECDHVDFSVLFSPQDPCTDSASDVQVAATPDLESSAPDTGLAVTPEPEDRGPDAASPPVNNLRDEPFTEPRMTLQTVSDNPDLLELQQQDPTLNGVRQKLVSSDKVLDNRVLDKILPA